MLKEKLITSEDLEGKEVKVVVKRPTPNTYRDSQIAYNKAFRKALEAGALLKDKLHNYFKEQGIWDSKKEEAYNALLDEIRSREMTLKKGGVPLKEARDNALKLRDVREKFTELIAEKQAHSANCAESQADNARFNHLVTTCVCHENGKPVWTEVEAYDADGLQPWAVEAAQELAQMLYGLDPDYDKGLVENQFLVKYKFADESLRLLNKDGHLVDNDGRLINDEGRFVAYKEDGEQYFVNVDGEEVDSLGDPVFTFSPFLDDDGNPIEEISDDLDEEDDSPVPAKKPRKTSVKKSALPVE